MLMLGNSCTAHTLAEAFSFLSPVEITHGSLAVLLIDHSLSGHSLVNLLHIFSSIQHVTKQEWRQEFSDGGIVLPTRGLKYSCHDAISTKNLLKK